MGIITSIIIPCTMRTKLWVCIIHSKTREAIVETGYLRSNVIIHFIKGEGCPSAFPLPPQHQGWQCVFGGPSLWQENQQSQHPPREDPLNNSVHAQWNCKTTSGRPASLSVLCPPCQTPGNRARGTCEETSYMCNAIRNSWFGAWTIILRGT